MPLAETTEQPHWRGINHLALVTADMDATVRFYHGVLGARLVATIGTPTFRHYFFEFGARADGRVLRVPRHRARAFAKPAGVPDPRARSSTTSRSTCPTRRRSSACGAGSKAHGCEVTDVVDHQVMRSIYFTDPNGIALEASWWVARRHRPRRRLRRPRFFADPDPVPAVRELAGEGRLLTTPTTSLTHDADEVADPA